MTYKSKFEGMKFQGVACVTLSILLGGPMRAQEVVLPENPGFTPEQAEAQAKERWSKNMLYPSGLTPPEVTRSTIRIDGKGGGRRWGGIGSSPATAMERQLMHYPKAIQEDVLNLCFKPNFGMGLTHSV